MTINDKENYEQVKSSIHMKNLKKLMNTYGYSNVKLAMKAKLSESTINSYLTGQKIPSVTSLISIANVFHCNIDYLLGRTDNPIQISEMDNINSSPEDLLFLHTISNLTKEQRVIFERVLNSLAQLEK